ncbi:MAG: Type 1 glutamine amidotransferase-like domain-containing protein [Candidatus Saccharimonadales bacterium]
MVKIIAIGGGEIGRPKEDGSGHHPIETSVIDSEILNLTGKNNPTLLFLPTASNDSAEYYQVVKKHFTNIGFKSVDVLYLSDKTLTSKHIEDTILSHDAIYVGGGNSLRMLKTWRRLGVDIMMKKALDQDVVLSGISAGSICWFSSGNSDSRKFSSGSDELIKVTGLGYIDAIHCPHYDTEPHRQDNIKRIVRNTSKVAIALDDCCAIEVLDDKYRIIKSKATAKAWKIYWDGNNHIVQEIHADPSYRAIDKLLNKQ